jgi:DNA-binding winged helix-turn-helix (wHTH) protein
LLKMPSGRYRFERFSLDPVGRQLLRDDAVVELNSRYLDALNLMVREQGRLVSKERFLEEVWRGVPVTDEALTQCIRTLRKQLGDDAGNPRFIETVPKHGYRFIASVTSIEPDAATPGEAIQPVPASETYSWRQFLLLSAAGSIGGGVAGMFGGLFYSAFAAAQPPEPGIGAASMLLVLTCVTVFVGAIGGTGVASGIAAAGFAPGRAALWTVVGGAVGGLVVGSVAKLIGLDTFNLLFGTTPGNITGGPEGALLGGAVGIGAALSSSGASALSFRHSIAAAGFIGALAGILIHLLGGRLMAGSLDLLASRFPGSRLQLDQIGRLFGESDFGPLSQTIIGGLEGALFGACVVAAMSLVRQSLRETPRNRL